MSETAERVAVACPSCSSGLETVHEVLKDGGHATVRCTECGHVHKTQIESETEIPVDVIVSQNGESFSTTIDAPVGETLEVGEEFIADTPEAILQVRITSIEIGDEKRAEEASVEDIEAVWTRAVDNVSVNVTLHPKDGNRDETRSITVNVPGDYEFTVGDTEEMADEEFTIEGLQVRQDAGNYRFDKFDRDGDMVFAKDVKRIYARDERKTAWSAW